MGGYFTTRKTLELINERGEVLKRNIIYTDYEKRKYISKWQKLYGKQQFEKLQTRVTETPL